MNLVTTPPIWARKGEAICCLKGHAVCQVAKDIYVGERRRAENFCDWRQPEPERRVHVASIKCVHCGRPWVRGNRRDGYQFHFAEGWR